MTCRVKTRQSQLRSSENDRSLEAGKNWFAAEMIIGGAEANESRPQGLADLARKVGVSDAISLTG